MPRKSLSGLALRAPFLTTYLQEGETSAYYNTVNNGTLQVNNSGKMLLWAYTPPVDVWAEVTVQVGLVNKVDAAYHYLQLMLRCQPNPVVGAPDNAGASGVQHAQVNYFGYYAITKLFGLAAGQAYTFDPRFALSGGSWQYYMAATHLWMQGKAWAR